VSGRTRRIMIRATLIAIQWICLTVALGSLVTRSEASWASLISPHLGAAPMFIGAFVAALLIGLTVEAPRYMVPLVLLMCIAAASFVGVISYSPVVDGVTIRTTALDNWVLQRVVVVTILLTLAAVPGAAAGNLLGGFMDVRHEVAVHPEDASAAEEVPWWEQRDRPESPSSQEQSRIS
jgi:hypothetical protein